MLRPRPGPCAPEPAAIRSSFSYASPTPSASHLNVALSTPPQGAPGSSGISDLPPDGRFSGIGQRERRGSSAAPMIWDYPSPRSRNINAEFFLASLIQSLFFFFILHSLPSQFICTITFGAHLGSIPCNRRARIRTGTAYARLSLAYWQPATPRTTSKKVPQ